MVDHKEFLLRQLSRTSGKAHENYVVTRIVHGVGRTDVKFITQQVVSRPKKGRAMTDLYLPQIGVHVEIDEDFHRRQVDADRIREADIVNATRHTFFRVDARNSLDILNAEVDGIVDEVRRKLENAIAQRTFTAWDPETAYSAAPHIARGYVDSRKDVAFQRQFDALNCFGNKYTSAHHPSGGGGTKHPNEPDVFIWFPRLYDHAGWKNSISDDEGTIHERSITDNEAFIDRSLAQPHKFQRLVFARGRGPLGIDLFRFKGRFHIDEATSRKVSAIVHRRVDTRAKTYR